MKVVYTKHSRERMKLRCINEDDVLDALANGTMHYQEPKIYKVHYGSIVLVVKELRKNRYMMITVLHGKKTCKLIKKQQKKNISYKNACKMALSV